MNKFKVSYSTKVRLLYTVSFLDLFACSLVIPLLSAHLRSLGASHFTIGALSSLYAGLQLVSGPVIGSWSDIHGHCFVLHLSLFCCSLLYFTMGAFTAVAIITIARIGLGLLKHTQSLCRTLLADIAPADDQTATQSRLVSFGSVGFIVGPAIGGHLAEIEGGFFYVCSIVMLFFWVNYDLTIPAHLQVPLSTCRKIVLLQKKEKKRNYFASKFKLLLLCREYFHFCCIRAESKIIFFSPLSPGQKLNAIS